MQRRLYTPELRRLVSGVRGNTVIQRYTGSRERTLNLCLPLSALRSTTGITHCQNFQNAAGPAQMHQSRTAKGAATPLRTWQSSTRCASLMYRRETTWCAGGGRHNNNSATHSLTPPHSLQIRSLQIRSLSLPPLLRRWDCEQSPQIWSGCGDITIV
jgi:hypothetical protein